MEESWPVSSPGPTTSPDALARCISIDLEVRKKSNRIHAFAGVRSDTGECVTYSDTGRNSEPTLEELDELAEGAEFVLGHNLIEFDLPRLRAERPSLQILQLPVIDTLRLSPLAFPRHPYHRLVKHYKDGQLNRQKPNDPELDARLTLKVFSDQQEQLLTETPPHLSTAWHWLTTQPGETGFDLLFESVRRSPRPAIGEARDAVRQTLNGRSCHQQLRSITGALAEHDWALAYALAWISVSGGNSVMPPMGAAQFRYGRRAGATPTRRSLRPPLLRLVPPTPRPRLGTEPLVRIRTIPAQARRPRHTTTDAAGNR